jgi:hypothetical protein
MSAEGDLPPPKPPECPNHARDNDRDWHDIASLGVWVVTFVAALTAAFFTGRQAYLENKQLRVSRDTLAVTQDTEVRQLRAYAHITPGTMTMTPKQDGVEVSIQPHIKVYGQTPAGGVVTPWEIAVAEWPMTDTTQFPAYLLTEMKPLLLKPPEKIGLCW